MREEIFKALCRLLSGAYDGVEIYIGDVPQQFARPSFLIEDAGSRYDPEHSCKTAENTLYLTVTCFGRLTDGYRTEDQLELLRRQQEVIDLFKDGRLQAGDRSIRASASSGGSIPGESYVDLTLSWLSGARVQDVSGIPLMMEVHSRNV